MMGSAEGSDSFPDCQGKSEAIALFESNCADRMRFSKRPVNKLALAGPDQNSPFWANAGDVIAHTFGGMSIFQIEIELCMVPINQTLKLH
jgi:hypothetical protein